MSIQEKIAKNYKIIMWGALLSAAHITVGRFQIIPIFIGYFIMYLGVNGLYKEAGIEYMEPVRKTATILLGVSVFYWVWGAFVFPYDELLTECIELLMYVFELSMVGDLLNKSVKLLKENDKVKNADKVRKNRMTFIKFYIGVAAIYAVSMVPALSIIRVYAAPTTMLGVKIFLSLIMQYVSKSGVEVKNAINS